MRPQQCVLVCLGLYLTVNVPACSFKEEGFSQKTSASYFLLEIFYTQKAASKWNNRTPSVQSMQTGASRESDSVTVIFWAHTFKPMVNKMGKTGEKRCATYQKETEEQLPKRIHMRVFTRRNSWRTWNLKLKVFDVRCRLSWMSLRSRCPWGLWPLDGLITFTKKSVSIQLMRVSIFNFRFLKRSSNLVVEKKIWQT